MTYRVPDGTGRQCIGPVCSRPPRGSGPYCDGHRQQVAKGAPLVPLKLRAALGDRHQCNIDECGKVARSGSRFCEMHLSRKATTGSYDTPPGSMRGPALERFTAKVLRAESGCWLWQSTLNNRGYGQFFDPERGGRMYAHRWSYLHHNGPIAAGLFVMHRCDVRNCVNPEHLKLGTHAENMADMESKGRNRTPACKRGHVWNAENSSYIEKNGRLERRCRVCAIERKAA